MKFIITALIFSLLFSAYASQKIEKVFEDESLSKGHITLFLSDGEVVHFEKENIDLLLKAKIAQEKSLEVIVNKMGNVSLDKADKIESIRFVSSKKKTDRYKYRQLEKILNKNLLFDPLTSAKLTSLKSYDAAQKLMDTFNGDTRDESQCYNRAHMWTYESYKQQEVNLGKLWIFFTHKYIRDYDYKWWFHVSPYANVNDQNGKYILDRGFTQVPFNVTNWKNIFIKNEANCPVVLDYNQYENNQEEEYCYLMYSSQYFWQPYQLKNYSTRGNLQTRYNESDLKISYKDALISWDGEIPGIDGESTNNEEPSDEDTTPTSNDSDNNPIPVENRPDTPSTNRPGTTTPPTNNDSYSSWVKIGENVINSNGFEGKVTRVLNPYQAEVRFQNSYQSVVVNTQYLAVRYGRSFGFSVGDYVKNIYGEKGKVTGIFQDGNVTVMFKGAFKHYLQDPRKLTRRLMY